MNTKLLALNCALALGLVACGGENPGTDSGMVEGTDAPSTVDAPVASGCGTDGLDCLTIAGGAAANMACTPTASSGDARDLTFRLVKSGLSTTAIPDGTFEIWTNNIIGADCAAATADCIEFTSGADGNVAATGIPGGWYAYRAARNDTAMSFATVGYNRPPSAAGGMDTITTIDATVFTAAINLIRSGISRDIEDGIMVGDVSDCDGEGMAGVTVRLFGNDGVEIMQGTGATDMGLAYRAGGALPNPAFRTTDTSGGYAAANVPIPTDGLVNVVTYGTLAEGGDRAVIGCEVVSMAANVVTVLSLGPARSDYPAGSVCEMMTQ